MVMGELEVRYHALFGGLRKPNCSEQGGTNRQNLLLMYKKINDLAIYSSSLIDNSYHIIHKAHTKFTTGLDTCASQTAITLITRNIPYGKS